MATTTAATGHASDVKRAPPTQRQVRALALLMVLLLADCCSSRMVRAEPLPPDVDLSNWKLQLPLPRPASQNSRSPLTINQPALAKYTNPTYFFARNGSLVLRVNAGGYKSPNSWYPRTELREMTKDGRSEAAWSIADPTNFHTLETSGTVEKFTAIKPEVVIMQIHTDLVRDPCSVPLIIKITGNESFPSATNNKVVANFQGQRLGRLSNNYTLGSRYWLRVSAGKGLINIYFLHGGRGSLTKPLYTLKSNCSTSAYFKSGCYIQSNVTMGEDPMAFAEASLSTFKRYDSAKP